VIRIGVGLLVMVIGLVVVVTAVLPHHGPSGAYKYGHDLGSAFAAGDCHTVAQNEVTTGQISLDEMKDFIAGCRDAPR